MSNRRSRPLAALPSELRLTVARTQRTLILFWNAGIVAAGYLRVQRKAKRLSAEAAAALWEAQHRRAAPRVLKTIRRLRGMFTKSGQYLSARPDLVPEAYIESLSTLQDAVPAHPFRAIAAQVERELGAPAGKLFARFERRPIASASLAQVHRATLHDGREVAVKVLYPDIEPLVRADLRNLGLLVGIVGRIWPRYDFRVIYREIARLAPRELDLLSEAASAERIARELSHRDDVVVPTIVRERSSPRVLTMAFIDGIKVTNVPALREAGIDPRPLAETIVDIFGDQVLGHGFFHGDPHPGNILILRDGRVALIDFGIALDLPEAARLGFATLSHSAASQDPPGMIRAIRMIGVHLPESDMATYLRMAQQTLGMVVDAPDAADDTGAAVNVRMARGFRGISIDGISGEALFVFRVQGLLRGLRAALGNPGNVFITWDGYARRVLAAAKAAERESA
jgi:predicted unusual protein kinase regulating ubiquinone biosynthesis (AarF/ABC1/UbiB family)